MAENYSVVSRDALDLIESQPGTITQRLRLASVFILLSLNVDQQCTRWGAAACGKWLGISRSAATNAISTLESMTFDDDESILEPKGEFGFLTNRKPTRRNPVIVPYILKARQSGEPGSSYIEQMFSGEAKFVERARRLMLMIRIYAAFDEGSLCCPSMMLEDIAPEPDPYLGIECALAPVLIFASVSMSGWMFPPRLKDREAASAAATKWLGKAGLLSLVRVVRSHGEISYVASYASGYWTQRTGNFQGRIREHAADEVFAGISPSEDGMPVFFTGGTLSTSVIPQRIVVTDHVQRTIEAHLRLHDEIIEELGEVE